MKYILILALVAGCKKEPATCAQLGPAIMAWGTDEIAAEKLTGDAAAKRQHLFQISADVYPKLCDTGKWSGEAIDCLIAAKTEDEAQKCPLTKDQREDMQKALMDALAPPVK